MANYSDPEELNYNQIVKRWAALDTEFSSWREHGVQISNYLLPRSGRFLTSDRNNGARRHNNILDSTGTRALRVLGAGLMGGATSPARPWFRLATSNGDLMKLQSVKIWTNTVSRLMRDIFQRSNTYRALHAMYEELGAFGTAACLIMDDDEDVIRMYPLTFGEYRIAVNARGEVCTLYRQFDKTVSELVDEFGYERCSSAVQNMYNSGTLDAWVTVVHAIEPRKDRVPGRLDKKNMPYKSVYVELNNRDKKILSESGFKMFRVLCPRWSVSGGDIYGNGPGHEALGDTKQLQHQQLRKAECIDYQTKPPLQIPVSMKNREIDRLPGGTSYVDMASASNQVKTLYDVNLRLDFLLSDIQDVRQRIQSCFYTDLFLMLSQADNTSMTATEVAERHEEKLLMLGPVLERLHNELLDPLIEITFSRMLEVPGLLPEPPEELQGADLNVEFISMLAQAQRSVSTNSVDRYVMALGNVAQLVNPDVRDRFDADHWADAYADMLGIDPEMIVDEQIAMQKRDARNKAQQQANAAAQVEQMAGAANKAANAPTEGKNALTDVIQQFSGYTTPQGL